MNKFYYIFAALFICLFECSALEYPLKREDAYISPSSYNFKPLSKKITAGSTTKYDKAKAIYNWIARSFQYDYSFSVKTADKAMLSKKGICQAICEVFYHLATAQGIETRIIKGMGETSTVGHCWIMFKDDKGRKVLADPTWSVCDKSEVVQKMYFDMDPRFAILQHYPNFNEDQLLEMPVIYDDYYDVAKHAIPKQIDRFAYGLNEKIYEKVAKKNYDFPTFYSDNYKFVQFKDAPLDKCLTIGKEYIVLAKTAGGYSIGAYLDNGNVRQTKRVLSDGTIELKFTPYSTAPLHICLENENNISFVITYQINKPTSAQLAEIERKMPFYSECLSTKTNIDTVALQRHGISNEKLLGLCKDGKLGDALPYFYEKERPEYTIKSIPLSLVLKSGKEYTFRLFAPEQKTIFIEENNGKRHTAWINLQDGSRAITIKPSAKGPLYLMQFDGKSRYYSIISYEVK